MADGSTTHIINIRIHTPAHTQHTQATLSETLKKAHGNSVSVTQSFIHREDIQLQP